METLLSIVRAVILVGAVAFSFGLLFFGFHVVVREYRLLRTRKQIEDFLRMTNEAGLQADVAKGTLSLSRTRPGILLIGIGAVLLIVCVLQPFVYESTSQTAGAEWVRLPTRSERSSHSGSSEPASKEQPVPEPSEPPVQSSSPPAARPVSSDERATHQRPISVMPRPGTEPPLRSTKITPATVEALRLEVLDRWLADAHSLKGKTLGEQAEFLRNKYGNEAVGFDSYMSDKPSTVRELASIVYGNTKYAPLILMSNPQLSNEQSEVPVYQNVFFLQPLLALANPSTSTTRTLMRITAGQSRTQLYDLMLEMAQQAMQSPDYRRDPGAWWNERGGLPAFERGLSANTQRKFAMKFYKPEENESPEIVAKILYGSPKYVPLLSFFNHDRPALFADPKKVFPPETQLVYLYLSEL